MKRILLIVLMSLTAFSACRSFEITNMEVVSSKDNKIIYRVDAVEDTFFSSRQVLALICVADNKGDLVCR